MTALLLNHLWQSTLCAGGAGLLVLALHRNGANVRFWLWFAASVNFLVPFAALSALGAYLTPIVPPATLPVMVPAVTLVEPLAVPFSAPVLALPEAAMSAAPVPTDLNLGVLLVALWAAGFLAIVLRWALRWSQVHRLLRDAQAVPVDAPVAVKFSASRLEPGLV
ncbi:MAG: hypothetical protein V4601_13810, partial [Pseudomonadota bacterium]